MKFVPAEDQVTETGAGRVERDGGRVRFVIPPTDAQHYSNAQVADYDMQRFDFRWRPPLRLTVTARASGAAEILRGTAGFGFWNHPFSPDLRRLPRLPRAIWFFFGAPPSQMALAQGVPGYGWKAAQIDTTRRRLLALLPLAPAAALAFRSRWFYDRCYPPLQRAMRIGEHLLDPVLLADWHTYTLEWRRDGARFTVDGVTALETAYAPQGPSGFIAWMDTQWAVVTPQGRIGFGLTPVAQEQSLTLDSIEVTQE